MARAAPVIPREWNLLPLREEHEGLAAAVVALEYYRIALSVTSTNGVSSVESSACRGVVTKTQVGWRVILVWSGQDSTRLL